MRLAGFNFSELNPLERDLLLNRLAEVKQVTYFQMMTIVYAIMEGAKMVASGEGSFNKTSDMLKYVRDIMFPEVAEQTEKKAERTKALIEKEMSRGPIKFQTRDYGKQKRKKKR